MQTVTTIGLDIAKSVFQVHGIDAEGKVLIRRQLKRRYVLAFFREAAARALLVLRPAPRHIIGRASSRRWPYGAADAAGLCEALVKRQKNDALTPRPSVKR